VIFLTSDFTLISKLNEENKDLPEFENRTDNIISDIQIRENEIEDILHTEYGNYMSYFPCGWIFTLGQRFIEYNFKWFCYFFW
jgi:hypothetical protein